MAESEANSVMPSKRPWSGRYPRRIADILWPIYKGLRDRRREARFARSGRFNAYEERFFSQAGEDGLLREIFFRIGPGDRYFVEFGTSDGSECNAAFLVRRYGWKGLMIEGDPDRFRLLQKRFGSAGVTLLNRFVSRENIVSLFREAAVPSEFDLLSIDVDGNDYWLWEALRDFHPRVVVIEYNGFHVPPERWVMEYNEQHLFDGTQYFGASLESFAGLGNRLGYGLIGTTLSGINAFFIRRDLLKRLGWPELTAKDAFHPNAGKFPFRLAPKEGPAVHI